MKLTHKTPIKAKSGMTLLELTVVILVLLSLISILFIGARAWKRGSDRAASILMIRNVQQAVRSHANMNQIAVGGEMLKTSLFGPDLFMENDPTSAKEDGTTRHPAGTGYAFTVASETVPEVGTLYMTTTGPDTVYFNPAEGTYDDW